MGPTHTGKELEGGRIQLIRLLCSWLVWQPAGSQTSQLVVWRAQTTCCASHAHVFMPASLCVSKHCFQEPNATLLTVLARNERFLFCVCTGAVAAAARPSPRAPPSPPPRRPSPPAGCGPRCLTRPRLWPRPPSTRATPTPAGLPLLTPGGRGRESAPSSSHIETPWMMPCEKLHSAKENSRASQQSALQNHAPKACLRWL